MAYVLQLPLEVTRHIQTLACPRHCNSLSSTDILINVQTTGLDLDVEYAVRTWVFQCLSDLKCIPRSAWNVVTSIVDTKMVFAIHLFDSRDRMNSSMMCHDRMVVLREVTTCLQVSALRILHALWREPCAVTQIGVSAVSPEYMQEVWKDITSKRPIVHTRPGRGFGKHPMFKLSRCGVWHVVFENSYAFDWELNLNKHLRSKIWQNKS